MTIDEIDRFINGRPNPDGCGSDFHDDDGANVKCAIGSLCGTCGPTPRTRLARGAIARGSIFDFCIGGVRFPSETAR